MAAPSAGPAPRRLSYLEQLRARWMSLFALATAAFGAFVKLTSELREGELDPIDRGLLHRVIELRTPVLNGVAVDVTALGSVTVVTLVVSVAAVCFALGRHWSSVVQLVVGSVGGALLSSSLKDMLERARPPSAERLVYVTSFSYPSGHSLVSACVYITLAIVVCRLLKTRGRRVAAFALAIFLAMIIGASRAYLGVHYPTDIIAGLLLGAGWALLVGAAFSYARGRGKVPLD
jgi:undecaprenyl-diphosphatase